MKPFHPGRQHTVLSWTLFSETVSRSVSHQSRGNAFGETVSRQLKKGGLMSFHLDEKEKLQAIWTMKLYDEYKEINEEHKLYLIPATIEILPLPNNWGDYNPLKNLIRLNYNLFRDYSWDTILEILKHEMAHQYIMQKGLDPSKPHGKTFDQVAKKLGLSSWARQASIDIPRDPHKLSQEKGTDEQDRLLKKAAKLLALAESASEHEAALAMERVRDLYTKYNLTKIYLKSDEDYYSCVITRKKQKIEAVESLIFSVLIEFFFVKVVSRHIYDHMTDKYYKGADILGKLENVKLAEYVYHFLWNQASTRSKQLSHPLMTAMIRRDFRYGLIKGFAEKLREQKKSTAPSTHGEITLSDIEAKQLMIQEDHSLIKFQNLRYPRLISRSFGPGRPMDRDAYSAGFSAGKQLNLHKGLHQNNSKFGGFLK